MMAPGATTPPGGTGPPGGYVPGGANTPGGYAPGGTGGSWRLALRRSTMPTATALIARTAIPRLKENNQPGMPPTVHISST